MEVEVGGNRSLFFEGCFQSLAKLRMCEMLT